MTDISDNEFEELPERDPAWLRLDRATAYRKRLLAAGYLPLPVNGKAPPIKGWPDIEATDVLIDKWAYEYADATNTGIITHSTPAVDIDVLDPGVADELQELAERMIGKSAVRTGRAPKRAMLFRADKPLSKVSTPAFISPDGRTHKVEILGWGQQIVVHGTHPDTQAPYTWEHTEPGSDLKADDLPPLTAEKANEFVTAAEHCMIAHGWTPKKRTNGAAGPDGLLDSQKAVSERERFYANATLDGRKGELSAAPKGERNNTLYKKAFRLGTISARGWISPAEVFDALFAAAASCGLNADDGEEATRKTLKSSLDDGMKCPHHDLETDQRETYTEPRTGNSWKYHTGAAQLPLRWLINGILPEAGVGLMAGQWGTFKTTIALDVSVCVMAGLSFAGRYRVKRRGAVLYIALEGEGMLSARLAEVAAHRGVSGPLPFAWRGDCPALSNKNAELCAIADEAAALSRPQFRSAGGADLDRHRHHGGGVQRRRG
jgi:hypothetical protein